MLRLLVVLLLMANAGLYAWQAGWLAPLLGTPAPTGRDPQRLREQVHAERLIVLGPGEPRPAAAPTPARPAPLAASSNDVGAGDAGSCLEAGPFNEDEQRQVQTLLARALPATAWTTRTVAVPGLWLVYMGPYPDADTVQKKQTELRRIRNLSFEEVRSPASLRMGLSLGRFNVEDQAQAALESMKLRGVRTARVVNLRAPSTQRVVRIPQTQAGDTQRLSDLALPSGKDFEACEPR